MNFSRLCRKLAPSLQNARNLRWAPSSAIGRFSSLHSRRILTWKPSIHKLSWLLAATTSAVVCYMSTGVDNDSGQLATQEASIPPEFLEELSTTIESSRIVLDTEELKSRGKPWNSYHKIERIPWVIISPKDTQEVSAVMKLCHKYRIPVTPFGGGTSLEGQTLSPDGGVSLDFSQMKKVLRISREDLDMTVQSGLGYVELNEMLLSENMWFPLDPGPGASIGGMCACRCSGSTAVYYGTMRDNVLNLTAVLADGTVIKTANRARKTSAGYDLTRLLIGSEGTLGIITEVTLKIHKVPPHAAAMRVSFPSVTEAAAAARATLHAGVRVGRCEMMDDVMMQIVNQSSNLHFPVAPTLLYEIVGPSENSVTEQLKIVHDVVKANGGYATVLCVDLPERTELWRIRKEALWSAQGAFPDCEVMITDVCVPLSKLDDLITQCKQEINNSFLTCPIVAHAGDGNFHVFIMFKPDVPEHVAEAHRLSSFMVHKALEMDGTCTGEHGVGVGKIQYLKDELGEDTLATMAKLKAALDPHNLLNPGKILEQTRDPATGRLKLRCG